MPNLAWTFPAALVLGAASVMCTVPATTNVQMRALPSMRGRVLALQGVVWIGTTPVGAPILGWVCEHLGPRVGLLIGAAACAVAVWWAMLIAPPMSGEVGATQPIAAT
jgi:MFS family permease